MDRVLFDDVVHTSYGQFDLLWGDGAGFDGDWDKVFKGQVNGLVGAAHGDGVYVGLARWGGGSRVRIVLADAAPPLALERYEDVVEVSVSIPSGAVLRWQAWANEPSGSLGALDAGPYRVRVSAHGRDAGHAGEFAEGVVDEYLIEFWPAPVNPDQIVRVGSENAKYWHHETGGRT